MAQLYEKARQLRKTIMDQVLSEGPARTVAGISRKHSLPAEEIGSIFKDLEAAVVIAVQDEFHAGQTTFQDEPVEQGMPPVGEIFSARPFSNFKNHDKISVNGEQKWHGMTKPLPLLGVHVPDPFFMFTPHVFTEWKRKGYKNFIRFSLH